MDKYVNPIFRQVIHKDRRDPRLEHKENEEKQ